MEFSNGKIKISADTRDNILEHDGKYYQIDFLNNDGKYVQGGNGTVFKLSHEEENSEFVIKIIKFPNQRSDDWYTKKRIIRFEREIEALSVAKTNEVAGIVSIEFSGELDIDGFTFQYYVMQRCELTLKEYLVKYADDLNLVQKTLLCRKILQGIQGLHDYKMYHRDIKHSNIYFIGHEPLIGDLGLVDYQNTDYFINERGDLIGPTGWFSPEAINKHLVEKNINRSLFDCRIDDKSEVFQLGKLFWYIYQGNIPIGQIVLEDFLPRNQEIFEILFDMLKYSKSSRIDATNVAGRLDSYLST